MTLNPNLLAPRGYTRNHVCMINPDDLTPAADIICSAIFEHMAAGTAPTPDDPQVVILSESHQTPSHLLLQAAVLYKLAAWRDQAETDENRSFLFSIEQPYNRLAEWSATIPELADIAPERYDDPMDYDPQGRLSNRVGMYKLGHQAWSTPCKLARHMLFQTCWENNITTRFSDAARDGYKLDFHDPVLARHADRMRYDRFGFENESADGNNALALRDAVMIERTLEAAKKLRTPLIIQQCGSAHLFGRKTSDQYDRSLTCSYKAALKRAPLPVFASARMGENITKLPLKALVANKNAVLIENMNSTSENNSDRQTIGQPTIKTIKTCSVAFSGDTNPLSRPFIPTKIEDLRKEMQEAGLKPSPL